MISLLAWLIGRVNTENEIILSVLPRALETMGMLDISCLV